MLAVCQLTRAECAVNSVISETPNQPTEPIDHQEHSRTKTPRRLPVDRRIEIDIDNDIELDIDM